MSLPGDVDYTVVPQVQHGWRAQTDDIVSQDLERERQMPYMTSFERMGLEKGLQQGLV